MINSTPESGTTPPSDPVPPSDPPPIPEADLVRALAIFKKRHKVTKLDQESKLGAHKPMTGGKRFDDFGIRPPNDYPREVWRELARQGKIKDLGGGFYSI